MSGRQSLGGRCRSGNPPIVVRTPFYAVELVPRRPVDRAGAMGNAQNAFPTAPWTPHRTRFLVLKKEDQEPLQ